ncbi:MAG: DUF484 family protein [Candidatus Puniceispirillales bacterium]|nr:DUF484 family protein [Pseudomonadota bacterium]
MTSSEKNSIIDLNHTLTLKAQEDMRHVKRKHQMLVDNSMANQDANLRLYHADLILLAASSQNDIADAIATYLPEILDVAAAKLITTPDSSLSGLSQVLVVSIDAFHELTCMNGIFLGPVNYAQQSVCDAANIQQPESIACVRLPDDLPGTTGASLLLLAGRNKDSFTASHGTDLLEQLVMKIAVAMVARPALGA